MKTRYALSAAIALVFIISGCKNTATTVQPLQQNTVSNIGGAKVYAKSVSKVGAIKGDGIYSDFSELYVSDPLTKPNQTLQVKLRAYKDNLTKVTIEMHSGKPFEMTKSGTDELGVFDYWTAGIPVGSAQDRYVFKVENNGTTGWYNSVGFFANRPDGKYDFWLHPQFQTPNWSKNSIYYQIFVDRFFNGNTANDVKTDEYAFNGNKVVAKQWGTAPENNPPKNRDFYGGDIAGVSKKLSYLKSLGVGAIYFNPVFNSPSNHKYDTQDYRTIDPHFATNDEFKKFVAEAKANGVRVVIDGVFNHTGSRHQWFDKEHLYDTEGAFESKSSKWSSFYNFNEWPNKYISWWGFDTLPKLNYASNELRGEIYANNDSIARSWISQYGISGWRLDVPNEAGQNGGSDDHSIWKGYRKAVKSTSTDAVIFGEIWSSPQPWLQGDEFDAVMNYNGFSDPVSQFINGFKTKPKEGNVGKISPDDFMNWMRYTVVENPLQSSQVMLNLVDSHDTSRFFFRAGQDKWKAYEAAIMQMTYIGSPMIYYGDEILTDGDEDPDCRRTFNWNYDKNEHLIQLYQALAKVRNANSALRTGTFETLMTHNADDVLAFARMDKKGKFVVILNNSTSTRSIKVPVEKLGWDKGTKVVELLNNTTLKQRTLTVDQDRNITVPVYGHYGAIVTVNGTR